MTESTQVELTIIGGGLAGLSLGQQLASTPLGLKTLIIEPREAYANDRTWSFWAPPAHQFDQLVSKTWNGWAYGELHAPPRIHNTPETPYQSIRSIEFYQAASQAIFSADDVELALGERVEGYQRLNTGWLIQTNEREIQTRYVIDTRPPNNSQLENTKMLQCFIGEHLVMAHAFNPDQAELMTDMIADEHGFLFSYVLPLSRDEALVEATRFSAGAIPWPILKTDLDQIKTRRGWREAQVTGEEKARLPMGLKPRRNRDKSWVHAGTAAGGLRAASGYGFMRIQRWAKQCHDALRADHKPIGHPAEPRLQGWMDELFLDVLIHEPARVPELFHCLYSRAPVDSLIRFMSDQSSLLDKLQIIRSLPAKPFLRTMMRR